MIKAVLLDVDDTLLDFQRCATQSMHLAACEHGLTLPDNVFSVFKPINDGLWKQVEQGTLTLPELHRVRWKRILEALNMEGDGEALEKSFVAQLACSALPVDGAAELLAYLQGKYVLAVASNAHYREQVERLRKAGFLQYFSHVFVSERMGAAKPATAFFQACCRKLALPGEEIMMVGDSLQADILGAKACGMATCWFNPRDREGMGADHTVHSLAEIGNLL